MFFKFVVDNQEVLGNQMIHLHLVEIHRSSASRCLKFIYTSEAQAQLETFVQSLSAQFVANIVVHIDSRTVHEMASLIQYRGSPFNLKQDKLITRIRDWCLEHRTLIKAESLWAEFWENKDSKYSWLRDGRVRNNVTEKSRSIEPWCRDPTCDHGDKCSSWH